MALETNMIPIKPAVSDGGQAGTTELPFAAPVKANVSSAVAPAAMLEKSRVAEPETPVKTRSRVVPDPVK